MDREVRLQPLSRDSRPVIKRLWQLYWHDMSQFRGSMPDDAGLFPVRRLESCFDDPDRVAYLLFSGARLAGFALVRGLTAQTRVMGDFFVVRAARRYLVGHSAALQLLARHPGKWEIPFQDENPGAARFWRGTAAAAVGDAWTEERRAVPGKPHLPDDVWISLVSQPMRADDHGTA